MNESPQIQHFCGHYQELHQMNPILFRSTTFTKIDLFDQGASTLTDRIVIT